jgi:hypothetical protein
LPIVDWPASTVLSIWRISLNTAFFMPIDRSFGLPSTDCSDLLAHCQGLTLLTIGGSCRQLCSSSNRPIMLCFSSAASPALVWPVFFQKRCQHIPPSFGVNNLSAPKFPWIRYLPWFEVSHWISTNLRGHKYNCPGSYFSSNLACSHRSRFQATNPKLWSFCWVMASSSSVGGFGSAPASPKASLSSVPLVFLSILRFYLFLNIVTYALSET